MEGFGIFRKGKEGLMKNGKWIEEGKEKEIE